jgi:hypothetical protein
VPLIYYYCVKIDGMAGENTLFTVEQIDIIEKLRAVLNAAKAENLHITGITDYEVQTFEDAAGKPYVSLT